MRYLQFVGPFLLILSTVPVLSNDKPASAVVPSGVVVKRLLETAVTSAGDPIVLPQGDVQIVVSSYYIPAGAALPVHKHPYPRYGYMLAGTLQVTNVETGNANVFKAGDFILEAVDHWHKADSIGIEPVKLVVLDFIKKDEKTNVVPEK